MAFEASTGGSVILSWPEEAAGFSLQASDRLGAEARWQTFTRYQSVPSQAGQVRVSIAPQQAAQFYRLGAR